MTQNPDPDRPDQPETPDTTPLPPAPPPAPHGDPIAGGSSAWGQPGTPPPPPGYDSYDSPPPPPPPIQPYQQPYQQSGYQQPQQPYQQQYQQPGYAGAAGIAAPYGIHPATGLPYSDKQKLIAGLLQLLLPLGIGRMYMGHTGMGVAQLVVTLVTCGIGALWPFIDGIIILTSDAKDSEGRVLRS